MHVLASVIRHPGETSIKIGRHGRKASAGERLHPFRFVRHLPGSEPMSRTTSISGQVLDKPKRLLPQSGALRLPDRAAQPLLMPQDMTHEEMMKITSSVLLVALAGCAGGTIGVGGFGGGR